MAQFDASVLKQPRWILAIVVGVVLALSFIRLGIWQLDRLDERRASNAVIEDRRSGVERPIEGLIGQYGLEPTDLIDRAAVVEGTYRTDLEFFSVGRTYGDLSGTLVATPLELADGSLLVVVRGIVPPDTAGPPAEGFEPPSGLVVARGIVEDGEEPPRITEPEPAEGVLSSISRLDLEFIDAWIDGDVLPVSMTLVSQEPANADRTPVPVPAAELTEGSHLGYAVQWFAFALIVVVGVGYLIWRAGSADAPAEVTSGSEPDRDPVG